MQIETNNLGFYKTPQSLSPKKWAQFFEQVKEEYPVQYFFREYCMDQLRTVWNQISDIYYYWKCRLFRKYNIIKLSDDPRWKDSDFKIQRALEIILTDYIEKEDAWNVVVWDDTEEHKEAKKVLEDAYNFFKVQKLTLERQINKLMYELYGDINLDDLINDFNKIDKEKRELLYKLEADLEEQTTKHLVNIVKYRGSMWT